MNRPYSDAEFICWVADLTRTINDDSTSAVFNGGASLVNAYSRGGLEAVNERIVTATQAALRLLTSGWTDLALHVLSGWGYVMTAFDHATGFAFA